MVKKEKDEKVNWLWVLVIIGLISFGGYTMVSSETALADELESNCIAAGYDSYKWRGFFVVDGECYNFSDAYKGSRGLE